MSIAGYRQKIRGDLYRAEQKMKEERENNRELLCTTLDWDTRIYIGEHVILANESIIDALRANLPREL